MKNFLTEVLDLIYKKRCYFCKSSHENIEMCTKCYDTLNFNDTKEVRIFENIKIYSAGRYEKNMQKLIRGVKYHNKKDLAKFQAQFMYEYFEKLNLSNNFQIVPVPLFEKRQKERGYNHMELVGKEFSRLTDTELNTKIIYRIKNTRPQYKLKKFERIKNLENAFRVDTSYFKKNCAIIIIDDIYTTGSTFESMIKEFQKYGIKDIVCLSTAMAV